MLGLRSAAKKDSNRNGTVSERTGKPIRNTTWSNIQNLATKLVSNAYRIKRTAHANTKFMTRGFAPYKYNKHQHVAHLVWKVSRTLQCTPLPLEWQHIHCSSWRVLTRRVTNCNPESYAYLFNMCSVVLYTYTCIAVWDDIDVMSWYRWRSVVWSEIGRYEIVCIRCWCWSIRKRWQWRRCDDDADDDNNIDGITFHPETMTYTGL